MERKEMISYRMSLEEALDIVKLHLKNDVPDGYEFNGWANHIPQELLDDPEMIYLTFKKTDQPKNSGD